MYSKFGRANLDWIEDDFFRSLSIKEVGKNIAVLKVFLALAINSDFNTRNVTISYSQLEEITGLSRPLIAHAIKKLKHQELVLVDSKIGRKNVYFINDKHIKRWAKIPYYTIKDNLKNLSNRHPYVLGALKIFLVLLRHRNNRFNATMISHDNLRKQAHLQTSEVTMNKDVLLNHGFIKLGRYQDRNNWYKKKADINHIVGLTDEHTQEIITHGDMFE